MGNITHNPFFPGGTEQKEPGGTVLPRREEDVPGCWW